MDTWTENAEFLRMLSYDGLKQMLTWSVADLTFNFDLSVPSLYFILGVDGFHKDAINKWKNGQPWGHNDSQPISSTDVKKKKRSAIRAPWARLHVSAPSLLITFPIITIFLLMDWTF